MKDRDCAALGDLRSAYLDGALSDADRERVLAHLVGCRNCRAEVDELRTVRQLLHRMGDDSASPASHDLSSRLVSIAGNDAYAPVWSRPFRRTRTGLIPSARRTTRMRRAAAGVACGGLALTFGVIGYAAAPSATTSVADPTDRARSEFVASLAQFPLASRSLGAVMMVPTNATPAATSSVPPAAPSPALRATGPTMRPISSKAALASLQRAAAESDQISYSGTQVVRVSQGPQTISATVGINFASGQGSSVSVPRPDTSALVRFVPATASSRIVDSEMVTLLTQGYSLSGWSGSVVLGRAATVVEATPIGVGAGSQAAARWWIDNATGLLLWQETYDTTGAVVLASGFTALHLSPRPVFNPHLAPRLAISTTTASLTLSNVTDLASQGWFCRSDLAGLALVRLRSNEASVPDALHMVYSDGVSTLSVYEQRGTLAAPPAGSHLDESLRAYVRDGTPSMATWRSGDRVFTVVTDGSAALMHAAVAALPHQPAASPTTMGRVRAGWVRIIALVVG